MTRSLPILLLLSSLSSQAVADCNLRAPVRRVVYLTFDNTHLRRDNPNVPSDLEQMPSLYAFLQSGALLSDHHTPLISHTGTDLLTALTGLYGDRHGVSIANSFRFYNPDGTSSSTAAFGYWTDTIGDGTPLMLGADGKNLTAPWLAFTGAGCDLGAVASANIVPENSRDPNVGIALHCAAGSALCGGASDLLGHAALAGAVGPIADLDGNRIATFPGFDGMSASVTLGYVATLLEKGVPVVYGYISDAHDDHAHGRAFGPGEAGYVAQLAAYDRAFGQFFARLAQDGFDSSNTLFVITADEGDHFVGGAPSPASCDGVNVPCSYTQIGELNVNLTGLLAQAGNVTPWKAHSDSAINLWLDGNPAGDAAPVRAIERAMAGLTVTNLLTTQAESLFNFLADRTEMNLLHMITADPARTPTLTAFAKPDYYVYGGPAACAGGQCVSEPTAYAWNHGDVASDINTTWLGLVGPGVSPLGESARLWTDHADVRPTLLALAGVHDSYVHQGRVLVEAIERSARPDGYARNRGLLEQLGRVYKQLNAPVGALALASLRISTRSLASGDASFDAGFSSLTEYLAGLATRRDALAARMEQRLDAAGFGGDRARADELAQLIFAGESLIAEVQATADLVDLLPF
jgi:hypothetical protein